MCVPPVFCQLFVFPLEWQFILKVSEPQVSYDKCETCYKYKIYKSNMKVLTDIYVQMALC